MILMYVIKVRQRKSQDVHCADVWMLVGGRGLACYGPGFTNLVHIDSSCY